MRDQERWQRRQAMRQWQGQSLRGRRSIVPGIVLLIIGTAFLLSNLGFFDIRIVRDYWPVLLIAFGAGQLLFPRHGARSMIWSGALIVMGCLLEAQMLGYIRGNIWEIDLAGVADLLGPFFFVPGARGFFGLCGRAPVGRIEPGSGEPQQTERE